MAALKKGEQRPLRGVPRRRSLCRLVSSHSVGGDGPTFFGRPAALAQRQGPHGQHLGTMNGAVTAGHDGDSGNASRPEHGHSPGPGIRNSIYESVERALFIAGWGTESTHGVDASRARSLPRGSRCFGRWGWTCPRPREVRRTRGVRLLRGRKCTREDSRHAFDAKAVKITMSRNVSTRVGMVHLLIES